ncbi:MAG TPA: hypothetical protein VJL58_01910 [Pyrinomonadaceae bacterium]|nr:hypothetical protein [Pyrinomonadaceae bacterium]
MKRIFAILLVFGATWVVVPAVEAKAAFTSATAAAPQLWEGNQPRRRWNRRPYTVIRTRTVRVGYRVYRERIRVTYLPNGRTRTQVISRVRIR